jgi:hypothetical protein
MNNIILERKASTHQAAELVGCLFRLCHCLDLTPIPLKPKSKVPLVKWSDDSWNPTLAELETGASKPGINWGIRCGQNLAVIDFASQKQGKRPAMLLGQIPFVLSMAESRSSRL